MNALQDGYIAVLGSQEDRRPAKSNCPGLDTGIAGVHSSAISPKKRWDGQVSRSLHQDRSGDRCMKKKPRIQSDSNTIAAALSVSPIEDDHRCLQAVFSDSKWALHKADCLASALSILRKHEIGVVICERNLPQDTWMDMLEPLMLLRDAPPLIVTSRLADERLWAEALNLGAYDVLAKPFDPQELVRTTTLAWLRWRHRHDIPAAGKMKAMTGTGG